MDIGTLVTTLKLDSAKFGQDMQKAGKQVHSFSAQTNRALAKAQKNWNDFGKTIKKFGKIAGGVAAAGGGLYYLTKKTLDFADTVAKTSDKIGLSTDALQELRFAAERSGVGVDKLDNGLVAFSKRIGELKQGTGALSTYLKKLDENFVSQVASAGSVDEALKLVFNRMNEMTSASDKAALGAAAFSRTAGVAMTNMAGSVDDLRQRARDLGIVLDENLLRNSEKTIDSITDLEYTLRANFNKTLITLGPNIKDISDSVTQWITANDDLLHQKIPVYLDAIEGSISSIWNFAKKEPAVFEYGVIGMALFGKKGAAIGAGLGHMQEWVENLSAAIALATEGYVNWGDIATANFKELEAIVDRFNEKDLSGVRFKIPKQPVIPANTGIQTTRGGTGSSIDAGALKSLDTGKFIDYNAALKSMGDKWGDVSDEITLASNSMAENIGSSFFQMCRDGKLDFSDMAESIIDDLIQIQIQTQLVNSLSSGISSGLSSAGGWLSFIGSGIMNMFDSGGWVTEPVVGIGTRSGETYSFAERGPEFVSKGAPSGRAVAPVINIQNNTGSDIKEDNVQFDVEKMVLGIVLNGAANNKNGFRQSLSQVMRG